MILKLGFILNQFLRLVNLNALTKIASSTINFISNNKHKILYSDHSGGGVRMPNVNIKFIVLKLAWISRLIRNPCVSEIFGVVFDFHLQRYGGENFLLTM